MYYSINSLPFEIYILVLLFLIVGGIYGIFDMRKKRPGHPMIWVLPFGILEGVSLLVYRCSLEFTTNALFQKISHIFALTSVSLLLITFVVTFFIAHKRNYTNKEKLKELRPLMICCAIIVVICFAYLIFG